MIRSVVKVLRITLCISIILSGWSVAQASDEHVLRYGDIYHIQNQYGTKSYLDTRGAGCQGNIYCVSTAASNNRADNSGLWKIMSATGKADGDVVMVNDRVYLQNQYGTKSYLGTRGAGCKSNPYCVSTAYLFGNAIEWIIMSATGKANGEQLTSHEPVHFQNHGFFSFLDTRGASCQSNIYCVSAASSPDRSQLSGTWIMIKHKHDAVEHHVCKPT